MENSFYKRHSIGLQENVNSISHKTTGAMNGKVGRNSISEILLGNPKPNNSNLIFVNTKYGNRMGNINRERFTNGVYEHLRIFLLFGKFIGLIPFEGLFQKDVDQLIFRKRSLPSIVNIVITMMLAVNLIAGAIYFAKFSGKNAAQYAWAPSAFVFYFIGTFGYNYVYRKSQRLIEILKKWNRIELTYTQVDVTLTRDVNLVAGLILTSAILENAFAHFKYFPFVAESEVIKNSILNVTDNTSALEIYVARSHPVWLTLVPYHPVLAIYLFLCNKFSLYAWNYIDITIALMARVIYFKFKVLYIQAETILFGGSAGNSFDIQKWRQLCADHSRLCNILKETSVFVSPLIFISYAVNIYYVCLQLNLGLTPAANTSTIAAIYAAWSFFHLIARVYVISLSSSRINDWAHRISNTFRKCPNEAYILDVERTERFVSVNTIGFTGIGCFILTKPLILQIVSVVFTFEIVLLQAAQTTL